MKPGGRSQEHIGPGTGTSTGALKKRKGRGEGPPVHPEGIADGRVVTCGGRAASPEKVLPELVDAKDTGLTAVWFAPVFSHSIARQTK